MNAVYHIISDAKSTNWNESKLQRQPMLCRRKMGAKMSKTLVNLSVLGEWNVLKDFPYAWQQRMYLAWRELYSECLFRCMLNEFSETREIFASQETYILTTPTDWKIYVERERGMEYENDNIPNSSHFGFSFHYKFTLAYRYTTTSTERIQFYWLTDLGEIDEFEQLETRMRMNGNDDNRQHFLFG